MRDSMMISVPKTNATGAWWQGCSFLQRGEQIEAAFSESSVESVGFGGPEGSSANVGNYVFHFACEDLEQDLSEFPEVGRRLSFLPARG